MKNITFTIEINEDGDAIIRLPEGKGQQPAAATVADLTESIAKAMGRIKERHIGDHHHGDHHHNHNHDHLTA